MKVLNRLNQFLSLKKTSDALLVNPRCQQKDYSQVLGADGIYYPCCFTRARDGRNNLKELLGEDFEQLNIKNSTQKEIFASPAWEKLRQSFFTNPMPICKEFCPKSQILKEHWDSYNGVNSIKYIGGTQR